jgi:hypothetical protein
VTPSAPTSAAASTSAVTASLLLLPVLLLPVLLLLVVLLLPVYLLLLRLFWLLGVLVLVQLQCPAWRAMHHWLLQLLQLAASTCRGRRGCRRS